MQALGRYDKARELNEATLARYRRVLGEDHPSTLASANGLAIDLSALGEDQAARELDEDTLARKRRVLGEDHPDTLLSANNLAADLSALGDPQAARELDEDTLARSHRARRRLRRSLCADRCRQRNAARRLGPMILLLVSQVWLWGVVFVAVAGGVRRQGRTAG